MRDATTVEGGKGEGGRAIRAFASLLAADVAADWTLTANADGTATLEASGQTTTGPTWAMLAEIG